MVYIYIYVCVCVIKIKMWCYASIVNNLATTISHQKVWCLNLCQVNNSVYLAIDCWPQYFKEHMMALSHTCKRNGPNDSNLRASVSCGAYKPTPNRNGWYILQYIWVQCRIFWKEEGRERMERYDGTGYGMKHGRGEGEGGIGGLVLRACLLWKKLKRKTRHVS